MEYWNPPLIIWLFFCNFWTMQDDLKIRNLYDAPYDEDAYVLVDVGGNVPLRKLPLGAIKGSGKDIDSHLHDYNNPHRVTAAQVGTYTADEIDHKIEEAEGGSSEALKEHIDNRFNPHQVTASQVGAYKKDETDSRIAEAVSGLVGGWLGNKTVDEINEMAASEMKVGDHVTCRNAGAISLGNIEVRQGDDLYWVMPRHEWELKVVSDKGLVVDTEILMFN